MPSERVKRQIDGLLDGVDDALVFGELGGHWPGAETDIGDGKYCVPSRYDSDKRPPVATRSSTWSGTGRSFSEGL